MDYNIRRFIDINKLSKIDLINISNELSLYMNQNLPPITKQNLTNSLYAINDELQQYDIKNNMRKNIVNKTCNDIINCAEALEENNTPKFFGLWREVGKNIEQIKTICTQNYANKKTAIDKLFLINEELNKSSNPQFALEDDGFNSYIIALLYNSTNIFKMLLEEIDSTAETVPAKNIVQHYLYQISTLIQQGNIKKENNFENRIYILTLSERTAYFKLHNNILKKATDDEIKNGDKVSIDKLKDEEDNSGRSKQATKAKEWEM